MEQDQCVPKILLAILLDKVDFIWYFYFFDLNKFYCPFIDAFGDMGGVGLSSDLQG